MVKVKYDGPAQISSRRIAQDELGADVNEDGSSDYFVWDTSNDFVVEMPAEMFEILKTKAPNFSLVQSDDAPSFDDAIDDQAGEPAAPKSAPKGPGKKGTPKEA